MNLKQAAQALVAVGCWLIFGLMWWWTFENRGPVSEQIRSVVIVVTIALAVVLATLAWVAWNVRIYRRGDRREQPRVVEHDYHIDAAGRPVTADFEQLRGRRYVEIDVVQTDDGGDMKVYEAPGREEPSEEETASCVA